MTLNKRTNLGLVPAEVLIALNYSSKMNRYLERKSIVTSLK